MSRLASLLITCLAFVYCCNEAEADLALVLNTTNETLHFTGSALGTTEGLDEWIVGDVEFGGAAAATDVTLGFDEVLFGNLSLSAGSPGSAFLLLELAPNSSIGESFTHAGNGHRISYALLDDNQQAFLESQIGNSIVSSGNFGSIAIVSVPEPASVIVLCSALAALATRRRRL